MAHDLARDLPYLTVKAQNCECKAIEICGFDILGHEVRDVSFNKCLFREIFASTFGKAGRSTLI